MKETRSRKDFGGGGEEAVSYNGLYGEATPKGGTFFRRLEVYIKRIRISQAELEKGRVYYHLGI